MSRFFQRPENAIKRADDLLGVGQPGAALDLLHDVLVNKRNKSTDVAIMEPIMNKFITLSVDQRKGRLIKDVLIKYKLSYYTTDAQSIANVMQFYIKVSEDKVAKAQATAQKIDQNVEDLEATETPESILLSTVSAEDDKERADREVVTPWLKFLWESYKSVLETIRKRKDVEIKSYTPLDDLQHTVAVQAFDFCKKYERKTEFHRLCLMVKSDLLFFIKHHTAIQGPDVSELVQRYLNTRFVQLNTATELQLWQKAFETAEDIQMLFSISKRVSQPHLAEYYNKLAKIFTVGENHLFQAAAWAKFYNIMRRKQSLTEADQQMWASKVLVSALAVPIINTSNSREIRDTNTQLLINLLRVQRTPTRESLVQDTLAKNVYNNVLPEVKELYQVLEVQFHPLLITKKVAPLLKALKANDALKDYVAPLQEVILTRILQQLSQVYTTVKIDFVVEQVNFKDGDFAFTAIDIERFIVNGCRKGELRIRINHQDKTISFTNDVFTGTRATVSEGPKLVSLPMDQVRTQIARLAKRLHAARLLIEEAQSASGIESSTATKAATRSNIFDSARARLEQERVAMNARSDLLRKKRESRVNSLLVKDYEEGQAKREKLEAERAAERARLEEVTKRRAEEKIAAQRAEIAKSIAAEKVANFQKEMKAKNIDIKIDDTENIDPDKLIRMQVEYLDKQLKEKESKTKSLFRKLDHTVRALRKEEIKLLDADYDEQKARDRKLYDLVTKATINASQVKYKADMEAKKRMVRMLDDVSRVEGARAVTYKAQVAEAEKEAAKHIIDAKMKRIEAVRAKIAEEEKRIKEEERRKQEVHNRKEEERRRLEQHERERIRMEEEKRARLGLDRKDNDSRGSEQSNNPSVTTSREPAAEPAAAAKPAVWRRGGGSSAASSTPTANPTPQPTVASPAPAEPKAGAYISPAMRARQQQQQQSSGSTSAPSTGSRSSVGSTTRHEGSWR